MLSSKTTSVGLPHNSGINNQQINKQTQTIRAAVSGSGRQKQEKQKLEANLDHTVADLPKRLGYPIHTLKNSQDHTDI